MEQIGIPSGARILDVGFGRAEELLELASLVGPDGTVYGLERSGSPANKAARRLDDVKNIQLLKSEATRVSLPDASLDMVLFKGILYEVKDVPRALREAARLCCADGRVVIIDFSRFPEDWLRASNRRWVMRHPWRIFSERPDKRPGFSRQETLAILREASLSLERFEDNFAQGGFSGHAVPMFLAVARASVSASGKIPVQRLPRERV